MKSSALEATRDSFLIWVELTLCPTLSLSTLTNVGPSIPRSKLAWKHEIDFSTNLLIDHGCYFNNKHLAINQIVSKKIIIATRDL